MRTHYIYVHINKSNGLKYVGQTSRDPKLRWGSNGAGYKNQYFYSAIEEYGWDNFEHIVLEKDIPEDKIDEHEQYWIKYFNSVKPNGYNLDLGGSKKSEETRQKMKNSWTDDLRKQKSELMTEYNKKADRTGINNGMYGASRTGANAGNKRKVQCINTNEIFLTVTDASRWCSGKPYLRSHIAEQINGKRKSCGKHPITGEKLCWRYID